MEDTLTGKELKQIKELCEKISEIIKGESRFKVVISQDEALVTIKEVYVGEVKKL